MYSIPAWSAEEQKIRAESLENRHKAELRLKLALERIEQCRTAREAVERASGQSPANSSQQ